MMTEYSDRVRRHAERMEAEEWGKKVKYLLAQNGQIIIEFNNGDKRIENTKTGVQTWERSEISRESLIDKFGRIMTDMSSGKKDD